MEPIATTTPRQRELALADAGYNLFLLPSDAVLIDLLTDSGTGAMRSRQWGGMLQGDESYAGSSSFRKFEQVVRDITGFKHVLPTHQGRAAEKILFGAVCKPGDVVPNNAHFDTTRAHVEVCGAEARDLVICEGRRPSILHPFKGNIDLDQLRATIREAGPESHPTLILVANLEQEPLPFSATVDHISCVDRVLCASTFAAPCPRGGNHVTSAPGRLSRARRDRAGCASDFPRRQSDHAHI